MTRRRRSALALLVAAVALGGGACAGADDAGSGDGALLEGIVGACPDAAAFFEERLWRPILSTKCVACHHEDGLAGHTRLVLWDETREGWLEHDFAARVGAAVGARGSASNEAVTDGEVALSAAAAAIWLLGDESTNDHTFTAAEQAVVNAYLDGGGGIVVSGSEVAWDLSAKGNGVAFISGLGASYGADDSNSLSVSGVGALAAVGSMTYSGAGAPYQEDFPDVLATTNGATVVLRYGNNQIAGVARAGRSAVVGFPLELVDDPAKLAQLVSGLVEVVTGQ